MSGIIVLLSGDFRQILPIIKNSTPAEVLRRLSHKSSSLRDQVSRISLAENMRVHLHGDSNAQNFTETLLRIRNVSHNSVLNDIQLTSDLCQKVSSLEEVISTMF